MVLLDLKTYELKPRVVCLGHTQHTVMKQAQGHHHKHCQLRRGKIGRHWSWTILRFPLVHTWPISHTWGMGGGHGSGSPARCSPCPWLCPLSHPSSSITLLNHFWRRSRKMWSTCSLLLACKTLGTQRPFKFVNNFNSGPFSSSWRHFCPLQFLLKFHGITLDLTWPALVAKFLFFNLI